MTNQAPAGAGAPALQREEEGGRVGSREWRVERGEVMVEAGAEWKKWKGWKEWKE